MSFEKNDKQSFFMLDKLVIRRIEIVMEKF